MSNRTCATCKAFCAIGNEIAGECRLYPPVIMGETFCATFPSVYASVWCLEWQSKEKAEKAPGDTVKRKTPVPDDFTPNARACEIAAAHGQNVHALAAEFKDHWKGIGEVRADWQASFRNWLRKDVLFKEKRR